MVLYEPREDSELLEKYVKKYAFGSVLDMGTGTGVQAVDAARKKAVTQVVALDIDPRAVAYCLEHIKNKKITFAVSDLFQYFKNKRVQFDTITFNPPYLPEEPGEEEAIARAVAGGKHGYELLGRFLHDARAFLKPKGTILIVFSSLTDKNKVDSLIAENCFEFTCLEEMPLFFEKLYCYLIRWNPVILAVMKKGVRDLSYFAHGRRGVVLVGRYRGKKVAVKIKRKESEAVGKIANEARWLKKLGKHHIGPHLVFSGTEFVVYDFVEGDFILGFIQKNKKEKIGKVLVNALRQCFTLDQLRVTKEEMHRPLKHIIVKGTTPTLIDFERAHKSDKPKNVTQFVQFLCVIAPELRKKGFSIDVSGLRRLALYYKHHPDRKHFDDIVWVFR